MDPKLLAIGKTVLLVVPVTTIVYFIGFRLLRKAWYSPLTFYDGIKVTTFGSVLSLVLSIPWGVFWYTIPVEDMPAWLYGSTIIISLTMYSFLIPGICILILWIIGRFIRRKIRTKDYRRFMFATGGTVFFVLVVSRGVFHTIPFFFYNLIFLQLVGVTWIIAKIARSISNKGSNQ